MTDFAPTIRLHHATRAKAAKLAATLAAEYPRLTLVVIEGEELDHDTYSHECGGYEVQIDEGDTLWSGEKVPELADLLDACAEQEIDPTKGDEEEEDEPRHSGSVVAESYRQTYREVSSNGRNCGDWLAERLVADTNDGNDKLIVDALIAIFEANGVSLSAKWAQGRFTQSRGWQGRFRMSGRIVLEKSVTKSGVYIDHQGTAIEPDANWLADMRSKHAKWLAKEAKREAAAEAAVREAVEGTPATETSEGVEGTWTQTDEGPVFVPAA